MSEIKQVLDVVTGSGGLGLLLGFGALVLLAVVVFCPSKEPHRRLLALVRAWRGNHRS
jgi:hypothetical protein